MWLTTLAISTESRTLTATDPILDKPPSTRSLAPLAHPVFRAVWITSLITNFGSLIQSVGASWMMSSIASADMVAMVQASVTLPIMLLSLFAGALADTVDRRILMLSAQTFMLVVSVILAAVTALGWITPWTLLLFTFLIGCGTAFNGPAWQASVGDMVPRRDLAGAVTMNSMGFNLARSLGPAIGGLIVAAAGAAAAFAVNAVSYLGLIVVLFRWKPDLPPQTLAREQIGSAMSGGVRYVAMSPRISSVLLRAATFGMGASAIQALMPLVARHSMAGGPETFGLLLGAFGVGAVGGAFMSGRARSKLATETLVRTACLLFGACAAVVALSPWLALTMPALAVAGAAWVLTLSTLNVTVQMSSPRWVVARALALYQMSAFGGMTLGAWVWGQVTEASGLAAALLASAVVQVVCAAIGLKFPLAPATELNLDPLMRWSEPVTAIPIEPRSGPVVVTIDYLIDEDDMPEFLTVMAERRRMRRRDGARHWSLLRDLADPRRWIERYHTETWVDYVRHNLRRTHDDAHVSERITALHRGPEAPVVHRMLERPARPPLDDGDQPAMPDPLTDPSRLS